MEDQPSSVFREPHQLIGVVVFFSVSTEPARTDSFRRNQSPGDLTAVVNQLLTAGAGNDGHNEVKCGLRVLAVRGDNPEGTTPA